MADLVREDPSEPKELLRFGGCALGFVLGATARSAGAALAPRVFPAVLDDTAGWGNWL